MELEDKPFSDLVWCENSADRLGGPPLIVVEDSAHPFVALNSRIHVDHTVRLLDQPIVEPVVCENSADRLRSPPIVIVQHHTPKWAEIADQTSV